MTDESTSTAVPSGSTTSASVQASTGFPGETKALEEELRTLIIDTLSLEDDMIEQFTSATPLFGEGLGLDSVDALELGVALKKKYGVTVDPKSEETKKHFYSVQTLTELVGQKKKDLAS